MVSVKPVLITIRTNPVAKIKQNDILDIISSIDFKGFTDIQTVIFNDFFSFVNFAFIARN